MIYWIADDDCVKKNRYQASFRPEEYRSKLKLLVRKIDIALIDKMIVFGKKNAQFVISQTKVQQEKMLENFGIKSTLIRNSYSFDQQSFPKKENVILWVGNFRNSKQPELFVEIAKNALFAEWKFIMIGDSSTYFQEIKCVKLPNFEYLGPIPLEQSSEWFAKAKIYINTSLLEGFPNAFIQSWYYKTFILSLVADPDFVLSKEKMGVSANGDLNQLIRQLDHYCSNPEEMQPILDRGYDFVRKEFDIKKNTDKLISVLSE